ncbi:flavin reductase family protein [Gordonia rubripertincta]|uniref:Flavin reductase family protein n=1 Tax=Gordonia rubripertincta TaxID=36822 RepID=A0ABT4MW51_GORRU|nr:flavin reductase family protein [Gordonia rubripertincta]MCZ4551034.1 flavin reductase family protein [Gordonia rubripertincta]
MIIGLGGQSITVQNSSDFSQLHIETTNSQAELDDRQLANSGLGHLDGAGHAALDVRRLEEVASVRPEDIAGWKAMLDYAEHAGWMSADGRFVRAHIERVVEAPASAPPATHDFRNVLGHFPSGVAVVTGSGDAGPVGFSCQSFASLSLEPPMILILPGKTSTSWPLIQATGKFCANVLSAHQHDIATQFARSGTDKFSGTTWTPGRNDAPRLAGACAWIEADIVEVNDGGDHLVVHGLVTTLDADSSVDPLIFHRGAFARLHSA